MPKISPSLFHCVMAFSLLAGRMFPHGYTARKPGRPAERSAKSGALLSSAYSPRCWSRTSRCWGFAGASSSSMHVWAEPSISGPAYGDPSEVAHVMRPRYDRAVHSVAILPETPLTAFLDRAELGVNSYHHQAIKALAPGPCGDGSQ